MKNETASRYSAYAAASLFCYIAPFQGRSLQAL